MKDIDQNDYRTVNKEDKLTVSMGRPVSAAAIKAAPHTKPLHQFD